jgi:hypothetical protein
MVETEVLFDDKYRARASKNEGKKTTFSSSLFPKLLRARPDAAHTHTYTFKKHEIIQRQFAFTFHVRACVRARRFDDS